MTFDEWWATLTPAEQKTIGLNNAKFVWQEARKSKREWVGLTEEDFFELAPVWFERETSLIDFVAMVEAKLRERNT